MNGAPVYRDALALAGVLLEELPEPARHPILHRWLADGALRLLADVRLALVGIDRAESLAAADAGLAGLRAHLDLAYELQMLREESFLALAEQAEKVGRQLGGWRRKLAGGSSR